MLGTAGKMKDDEVNGFHSLHFNNPNKIRFVRSNVRVIIIQNSRSSATYLQSFESLT